MRKVHPCDKCGVNIHLKYRHCRPCSFGKQQQFRGRKELLRIRAEKRTQKRLRQNIRAQKLPAKGRVKSKIIDALLRGESAASLIEDRSNSKVRTVLRGC